MSSGREASSTSIAVLVLSESRQMADALDHALRPSPARVLVTSSIEEAMQHLQRFLCALVIVDLPLEAVRARDLVARLRAVAAPELLPIVLRVDARTELDDVAQLFEDQAVDVVGRSDRLGALVGKARLFVGVAQHTLTLRQREEAPAGDERDTQDALKALVSRNRALTDNATLGLVLMDVRQHCTFMNRAAEQIFGLTLAEVQGRPLHDFVHHTHPDGRPYPIEDCPIDRALPTRMQERGEDVFVRPDGTFYPVVFTASPIIEDGVPVGTVIELRDVTDEKREQALQERRARHAALMGDIGAALTRGIGESEMLRACLDAIARRLEAMSASVWSPDQADGTLRLRAASGQASAIQSLLIDSSGLGSVLRSGTPLLSSDIAADARLSHPERSFGPALVAYPLVFEDRVSGVLAVHNDAPFEQDTGEALAAVADAMALGVERLRVEQARRESEERFRNMADHAPVMLWVTDAAGACTYLSKGWYDFTGQTEETGLGLGWLGAVHPDDAERSGNIFLDANARHAPFRLEYRLRRKDGEFRWAIDSASPRFGPGGEYLGYVGSVIDISERVTAEDEIRRLNASLEQRVRERTAELEQQTARLEDANRELEAFGYSVSHDLRAPLRHIAGFAKLLDRRASAQLDDKAHEYLQTISEAANRGGQLVDALLAFSRLGKAEPRREQVALSHMVDDLRDELQPDLVGRKVTWHVTPLPTVVGDERLLRAVLKNLLSNALKYSRTRAETRVEIGASIGESEVEIWVRDNGVGFDMAYVDKLFGVFQRLHTAEEFEGTGIGLANVRRIVQRHGGRVWADAKPGEGAVFHFTLPHAEASSRHA